MSRNRAQTELAFLAAARSCLLEHGFGGYGINPVAELAGHDKVLLYRYFGDLAGLSRRLAEQVQFFPDRDIAAAAFPRGSHAMAPLEDSCRALLASTVQATLQEPLSAVMLRWEGSLPDNHPLRSAWREQGEVCATALRGLLIPADGTTTIPGSAWFHGALRDLLRAVVLDGERSPWMRLHTAPGTVSLRYQSNAEKLEDEEMPVELL